MEQSFSTIVQPKFKGFYKIWAVDKKTGAKKLLVSKPNMILYQGADLMAQALAGVQGANISHVYIGYNNVAGSFTPPTLDKENTTDFPAYGLDPLTTYGYLRLPLSYSPTFSGQDPYDTNTVVFTAIIATTGNDHGAEFAISTAGTPSQIFEIALAAEFDPSDQSSDKLFSRAQFDPVLYDENYNLTIAWGIQFLA